MKRYKSKSGKPTSLRSKITPVEQMLLLSANTAEDIDHLLSNTLEYICKLNREGEPCALVCNMLSTALNDQDVKALDDHWYEIYQNRLSRFYYVTILH